MMLVELCNENAGGSMPAVTLWLHLRRTKQALFEVQVSLVGKDSSMLDGFDTASHEMDEAKVRLI
jgi:hypothetical protein